MFFVFTLDKRSLMKITLKSIYYFESLNKRFRITFFLSLMILS